MATFTTRTLFEIEEATEPSAGAYQRSLNELRLKRFEVIALVAIADQLDEATEQLTELVKQARELVDQRRELLEVLRETKQ